MVERAHVHDGGQRFLLTERADATHDVAGESFGGSGIEHVDPLGPHGDGHGLQRKLPGDRDDAHGVSNSSGGFDQQRFEHPFLDHSERDRGGFTESDLAGSDVVVEGMNAEVHSGALESDGGRCSARWGSSFRCGRPAHEWL